MHRLIKRIINRPEVKEAFKKVKAEKKTTQTKTSTIKNKTNTTNKANTIKTNTKRGATILNRFNFLTKKYKIDKKTLLG